MHSQPIAQNDRALSDAPLRFPSELASMPPSMPTRESRHDRNVIYRIAPQPHGRGVPDAGGGVLPLAAAGRQPDHGLSALAAIDRVSRRIEDLARELNCLGFFDAEDDCPRAA